MTSALWVWTLSQWRRRRGAALASTILLALAVAVVLGTAAGARRTQTAYPRMLAATATSDLLVNPDLGVDTELDFDAVAELPNVEATALTAGMFLVPEAADGGPDFDVSVLSLASTDGRYGYTLDRALLTEGRAPDPEEADEVLIDPEMAEHLDAGVGDTIVLLEPDFSNFEPQTEDELPPFVPLEFRVTGIGLGASQLLTDEQFDDSQITLTPAFYREHADMTGYYGLSVDLTDESPERVLELRERIDELAGAETIEYRSQQVDTDAMARAVRPQVVALAVFAALTALAALVVVGQSMARVVSIDRTEALTLQALGVRRRSLFTGGLLQVLALGLVGVAAGVAGAIVASSRFPLDLVRNAEPNPGIDVNVAVLAIGAAAAIALLVAVVALPLWRSTRILGGEHQRTRPSTIARTVQRWGAGPSLASGVHFALDPPTGSSAATVRSSLAGGIVVAGILSAAVTFGASLSHLADSPPLYGWAWDVRIDVEDPGPPLAALLDDTSRVAHWSRIGVSRLTIDGVPVPSVGVTTEPDAIVPTVVDGRPPTGQDEIVLGARTMRRLGKSIGDDVTVTAVDGQDHLLRVVGQAVFPGLGTYSGSERTELGTGAMSTYQALARMGPDVDKDIVVVRLQPGEDADAFGDDVSGVEDPGREGDDPVTIGAEPERPSDILALDRVRQTPLQLALLVAVLILVQLTIQLFAAGRRRRRDLALLTTVGFVRRQVVGTVAWQIITFTVISLGVGLPLGVAVGRSAWTALVDSLGAGAEAITPFVPLAVLACGTITVGALLALIGGTRLTRHHPAVALRAE